jgi:hypothetical protein
MTDNEISDRSDGQSFRDRTLDGVDLSGQDLRGADFTGASLRSASFVDAKFGVAPRVGVVVLGIAVLVTVIAGVTIGWVVNEIRAQVYGDHWDEVVSGGSLILVLLAFIGLMVRRGFDTAIRVTVVFYLFVLAGNVIANFVWEDVDWDSALRGTFLLMVLFVSILSGILARLIGGVFGSWSIALVAVLGGLATGRAHGGVAGIVVALSLVAISKRAVQGDRRDRSLRRLAHRLVARWGTRFIDADLSGADLSGTDASLCGVKGATLDGVTWDPAKPLPLDVPDDEIPPGR